MSDSKGAIEFKLNQLESLTLEIPVVLTNANIDITALPQYADKTTAEAALAVGEAYINTTTGALGVALA